MATILQRVLQTITPYTTWAKETPTNERKGQASPTTEKTSNPPIAAPSYQDDIKSFGEQMMKHIQSGALTQDILDRALQERANRVANNIELKKQETIAEIDREIEAVYQSLPESQRQRFTENVDRQTRIDAKLDTTWSDLFKAENYEQFSWQTDLISKLVQDPELEQLAASIRTKETRMGYPGTDQSRVDAYSTSPLGGPLVALRVQQASKSLTTLQTFVNTLIKGNRGVWNDFPLTKPYDNILAKYGFEEYIYPPEDEHTVDALLKTNYTPIKISSLICNAMIAAKIPVFGLEKYKVYAAQLSPEDTSILKTHYIQKFVGDNLINSTKPIDSVALSNLQSFLKDPNFVNDISRKPFGWEDFSNHAAEFGPIADVLLQAYDIDTVVPILEAYQGNRALDGSFSSTELISDVRAYLNERTTKTPTTSEANSDLQLS